MASKDTSLGQGYQSSIMDTLEHHSSGRPSVILVNSSLQNDSERQYRHTKIPDKHGISGSFQVAAFRESRILLPAQKLITRKKSSGPSRRTGNCTACYNALGTMELDIDRADQPQN